MPVVGVEADSAVNFRLGRQNVVGVAARLREIDVAAADIDQFDPSTPRSLDRVGGAARQDFTAISPA